MIRIGDPPQGSPPFSVDEDELLLILDIVIRGSHVVAAGPRMAVMNERRLCRRLARAMLRIKRAHYSSANIRIEREVTVDPDVRELHVEALDDDEDDLADDLPEGRIDLCFYLPSYLGQEQAYFAIEAKLLREGENSLNRSYVNDGVDRFHRGLYAPRMRDGMMLGFVMRGDGGKVAAWVDAYMRKKWGDTHNLGGEVRRSPGVTAFRGPLPRRPQHVDMDMLHVFAEMFAHETA